MDTAEGPGYLGGCWWLGSFPGGRGDVRTRKRNAGAAGEGRRRSAEAPAGSGLAGEVQTHWRQ